MLEEIEAIVDLRSEASDDAELIRALGMDFRKCADWRNLAPRGTPKGGKVEGGGEIPGGAIASFKCAAFAISTRRAILRSAGLALAQRHIPATRAAGVG